MKRVKLTQDTGVRVKGEILRLDDASAESLVKKKKVAEFVNDDEQAGDEAVARAAERRGNVITQQVVEADPGPAVAGSTLEPTQSTDEDGGDVEIPDGAPSMDWTREQIDAFAIRQDLDPDDVYGASTKQEVLDLLSNNS